MKIGMLWFDNDPKTKLESKVKRAAQYYQQKYGKKPTLCFVHPCMLPETVEDGTIDDSEDGANLVSGGVEVRTNHTILPNHFWIGVNGKINSTAG